jgi:outer membrane murein-binding lipoprotein Lpp
MRTLIFKVLGGLSLSRRPMKTALRLTFGAMILAAMLLSSGCEKKTAATNLASQSTPGSTKLLEAADLVGYDGKRLRKSVDRIKEANEKHNQELEKTAGSEPDQ